MRSILKDNPQDVMLWDQREWKTLYKLSYGENEGEEYVLLSQNIFKKKQTLTVVSRFDEPFLMRSNCIDPQKCNDFTMPCRLPANQNLTTEAWVQAFCFGYVVDLLTELSNNLRLHFDLYIVKDGQFGRSLNKTTQEWNGMIGDVIKGRASIALQGITISEERQKVVDFTAPYFESRVEILTLKEISRDKLFSMYFLELLDLEARYVLIGVFFLAIFSIYITENLVIYHSNITNQEKQTHLHLNDIVMYIAAAIFQKGDLGIKNPGSYSGRVTSLAWSFGFLVLISLYTALLTADRVVTGGYTTFHGMKDKRVRI